MIITGVSVFIQNQYFKDIEILSSSMESELEFFVIVLV